MAALTLTEFRAAMPAFSDPAVYDDPQVTMYLAAADKMVGDQWGDLRAIGMQLWTAHHLVIDALASQEAANGGVPGLRSGAIASEGGDSVNVSFDVTGSNEADAGHWNQTSYGKRFIHFARMFGAGPIQIGGPVVGEVASASAWAGVFPQ